MIRAVAAYMVDCDYCKRCSTLIHEGRYELALQDLEKLGWKVKHVTVNQDATVVAMCCPDCAEKRRD